MKAGLATDKWKLTIDDYVRSCIALLASMTAAGFRNDGAIPVDPDGELLGGAHRLACAIALELDAVVISRQPMYAWAPPWGRDWFVAAGMSRHQLARLDRDWSNLNDQSGSTA